MSYRMRFSATCKSSRSCSTTARKMQGAERTGAARESRRCGRSLMHARSHAIRMLVRCVVAPHTASHAADGPRVRSRACGARGAARGRAEAAGGAREGLRAQCRRTRSPGAFLRTSCGRRGGAHSRSGSVGRPAPGGRPGMSWDATSCTPARCACPPGMAARSRPLPLALGHCDRGFARVARGAWGRGPTAAERMCSRAIRKVKAY